MQDKEIYELFMGDREIPEIVTTKKEEAFNIIREKTQRKRLCIGNPLLKAAICVIAFLIVCGGTVVAAGLLSRYERYESMAEETKNQMYEDIQSGGNLSYITTRELSNDEKARYGELEKSYQESKILPEGELPVIRENEKIGDANFYLEITAKGQENVLHLPDTKLTDEQMLEIIEYLYKEKYILYKKAHSICGPLEELSDEDIDYYYLTLMACKYEVNGGFAGNRPSLGVNEDLSYDEQLRYTTLELAYNNGESYPNEEIPVMETGDSYSGDCVVYCREDGKYYLPDRMVTDEEMLQVIDFREKILYSMIRISTDIDLGHRTSWPSLEP